MSNYSFSPTSRYYDVPTTTLVLADGTQVPTLQRRLLPPSGSFSQLHAHVVIGGERLDNIAARELGDPLLFWRLCDANDAMSPSDLTQTIGRALRVTLPQGIPGVGG
jgi:hypothetical protein